MSEKGAGGWAVTKLLLLWIALRGVYYHLITSHGVPDIYWIKLNGRDALIVRTGPVRSVRVVWE